MQTKGFFLVLCGLIFAGGTAAAEIYRWVDEKGIVHYSDSQVQDVSEDSNEQDAAPPSPENHQTATPPNTESRPQGLPPDFFDALDEAAEQAAALDSPRVEIFVTSWCAYCHKAKNFFRKRGIEFTVYDVEKDQTAARRMMKFTKKKAVPFVIINGHGIQGYSEQAYELALQN